MLQASLTTQQILGAEPAGPARSAAAWPRILAAVWLPTARIQLLGGGLRVGPFRALDR